MKKAIFALSLAAIVLLSGCSGVSQENDSNAQSDSSSLSVENTLQSSKNDDVTLDTNSDDIKVISMPTTETLWAYSEKEKAYFASVGTDSFQGKSEDEIIKNCYMDVFVFAYSTNFEDEPIIKLYWGDPNTNETLGYCAITHILTETTINNGENCIKWTNSWEHFNENETNQNMIEMLNNFDSSATSGDFELDGYKVGITGNYDFSVVDNKFSEWNGKTTIKLEATVENVSSDYDYCMLFCTITAPNGKELTDLDSFFDDGLFHKKIGKGKSKKGYFTFPYEGDGEYKLVFSNIVTEKYTYNISVKKPSENSSKPENESTTSQITSDSHKNENFSYDNVISTAQDTYLIGGANGTRWYFLGSGLFATFVDDDEYKSLDDETLIMIAYANMLYNPIQHPNTIYPLYAMMFMEKDGTIAATGMVSLNENGRDMDYRLEWSGKYEYLNSHPKQIELFGESE